MSLLNVTAEPSVYNRIAAIVGERIGAAWAVRDEKQAGDAEPVYGMSGVLYCTPKNWLMLSVPNALVRGAFDAMHEPGIELPPSGENGRLNAHISVMRPEEIELIGGADKITERGKQFAYSIGRLMSTVPAGWKEMGRVWFLKAHSPALSELRRSYGLSSLPNEGKFDFHVTVAVRRKGVLATNEKKKVPESELAPA